MGLITGILTLPLAPVRGVIWVAEKVQQEAERQWRDPEAIHAALADLEERRERGLIDEGEADQLEEELIQRLLEADQESRAGGSS